MRSRPTGPAAGGAGAGAGGPLAGGGGAAGGGPGAAAQAAGGGPGGREDAERRPPGLGGLDPGDYQSPAGAVERCGSAGAAAGALADRAAVQAVEGAPALRPVAQWESVARAV